MDKNFKMSLFSPLYEAWARWAHPFDQAMGKVPVLGGWFAPRWSILIVHRDGRFCVPDGDQGQRVLLDDELRQFAQNKRINLRLGTGLGQQRDIALPHAARHKPAAMIALSLSQYFPFPEDDTAFAVHGPVGPDKDQQSLFRVSFARRSHINEVLQRAAGFGISPLAVDALGDDPSQAVSADLRTGGKAGGGKSASQILVGLCASLLVLAASLGLWSALSLSPKADRLNHKVQPVATDQAAMQKQAKASTPSMLAIWQAATRALPDTAYAQYLLYEKGQLRISGKADNAAQLVSAIESQPIFTGTTFAAASLKEDDGKESFDLTTRVQNAVQP